MAVEIGKQAPNFKLENQDGQEVSLSDYLGKNIILYFYPKDMTPGCTTQACDFRDNYEAFDEQNTVILGISPDPIDSHLKFISKHDLSFPLLADEDHEVAELYGVWQLKKTFGNEYYGIVRSTFIIDSEGILQKEYRNVRVKDHVQKTLDYVKTELNM
ncbi:MAG TPA: thioredoxin-dependent thiol peroxidase [Pseudogracilibacillus sp.]|nr:thioredoxin-dependent thiol peroxidase [Pseudogracilibacillus sp.]